MDPWLKIRDILEEALQREPSERSEFVHRACGSDSELEREVEEYLCYENAAEQDLLKLALIADDPIPDLNQCDPERIGPYRIVRRLGEGGMGIVYLAERDSEYKQQVALKALKAGPQSAQLLHLFRRERQILAQLRHPNIACLMDGGTADGQVFYVMEYIEGAPVTAYCNDKGLTTRERLQLFCKICDAVSYAHRKLIIHRDLKPGNILVTVDGTPKLLDFGLAKVFQETMTTPVQQTVSIGPMLTPAYASPEQVRGDPLGTGADIYSLGVLLYELLTGQNPQAGAEQTPLEVCRAILEDDPQPPSRITPRPHSTQLKGDLDNIVLMALRKEPEHRYAMVGDLREDIERYLGGFPVLASRSTPYYRIRKYIGRHRWGLAVSVLGASMAVAAAAMVWWEGRQAQLRFDDVQGLTHSVIFELHGAIRELPGSTGARKLIVERGLEYLGKLEATGAKKRSLELEMSAAYEKIGEVQSDDAEGNIGDTAGAVDSFLHARRILTRLLRDSPGDFETQQMLSQADWKLANVYEQRGEERSRRELSQEAEELGWKLASERPDMLQLKAAALRLSASNHGKRADWKGAEPLWEEAVKAYAEIVAQAPRDPENVGHLAQAHDGLAQSCSQLDQLRCALEHYQRATQIESAQLAITPNNTKLAILVSYHLIDLGWIEHRLGRSKDAIAHEERALALQEQVSHADPQNSMARVETAKTLITTGLTYRDQGDMGHAARCLKRAISVLEPMVAGDPNNQSTLFHLAWAKAELGDVFVRRAEAEQRARVQAIDWKTAADSYEGSLRCLRDLKLGGKLDGVLDDRRLRAAVPLRLAECRRHLSSLRFR